MKAFERIKSFAEYVGDVTRLRARRILRASEYNGPFFRDSDLQDCAGIAIAATHWDSVWLAVERLRPSEPPPPAADIAGWLTVGTDPNVAPRSQDHINVNLPPEEAELFVASGRVAAEDVKPPSEDEAGESSATPSTQVTLRLNAFPELGAKIDDYVESIWRDWAADERLRRKAIAVYSQISGFGDATGPGAEDEPIELVWGVGQLQWDHPKHGPIDHPVIEIPLDVDIEKMSERLALRPRWQSARLAETLFTALPDDGAGKFLESESVRIAEQIEAGEKITPFRRESFEPILRRCAEQIDPLGLYRPDSGSDAEQADDSETPARPVVGDAWSIYARPKAVKPEAESAAAQSDSVLAAAPSPAADEASPEPEPEPPAKDEDFGVEAEPKPDPDPPAAEPKADAESEPEMAEDAAPESKSDATIEAEESPESETTPEPEPEKTNGSGEDASRDGDETNDEPSSKRPLPQIQLSLAGPAARSGLKKMTSRRGIFAAIGGIAVIAAGGWYFANMPSTEERAARQQQDTLTAVQESQPSSLSPRGELADYFNLTSRHTADQRADKEQSIKGEIIEWDLPVQSVSKEQDGVYKVQTSAFMDTVGTLVTLHARNDAERSYLENLEPGDWIKIKGKIQGVASYDVEIVDAIPIAN